MKEQTKEQISQAIKLANGDQQNLSKMTAFLGFSMKYWNHKNQWHTAGCPHILHDIESCPCDHESIDQEFKSLAY